MNRIGIARSVALQLSQTEAAVDGAIAETGRLIAKLAEARADLRLSAVVGQSAAEHLSAALAALVTARCEVVGAHAALADVQGRIGLKGADLSLDMMGPLDKPPAPSGRVAESEPPPTVLPLRVV